MSFNAPMSAQSETPGNQIDLKYGILKSDAIFSEESFPVRMGRQSRSIPYLSILIAFLLDATEEVG